MSASIDDVALRRARMPSGSERFLETRSLVASHRRLAAMIRPGMAVLDAGCGSGAITRGIARAVMPGGTVLGIDVNPDLISHAMANSAEHPNLTFDVADIHALNRPAAFDVASAARVLQWLRDPQAALTAMVACVRPGGHVIVLDYDHTRLRWDPEPPDAVRAFYDAFLAWRSDAGMDNRLADRLPDMFRAAGLTEIASTDERESSVRGQPSFDARIALWGSVMSTRGHQLVADGVLTEAERADAETQFVRWAQVDAYEQVLHLAATTGVRPTL